MTYRPRRLILATGAHERPVPIPGWTLPGVLTTGGLQTLVRTQLVCPGERVLLAGTGPLNLQVACELIARGVKPVAVLDSAPPPWTAAWRDRLQHADSRARPDGRGHADAVDAPARRRSGAVVNAFGAS